MDIRKINDRISVAPQILPDDIPDISALGFRSLICNRPDGEDPTQPSFADIQSEAQKAGLETLFLPVSGPQIPAETVAEFERAQAELPGPVLAYCRSGTRSTILWGLSQMGRMEPDQIVAAARDAGYDLSGLIQP